MKFIRYTAAGLFLTLFFSVGVHSQVEKEYLKKQQEERERFEKERRKEIDDFAKQYADGISKLDKEFKDYLKQEWKRYELFKAEHLYTKPKPETIPEYEKPEKDIPDRISVELPEKTEPVVLPEVVQPSEPLPVENPDIKSNSFSSISFYGANISVPVDPGYDFHLAEEINEETISKGWEDLAGSFYNNVPALLFKEKKRLNLNDWGYYRLVKDYSEKISPDRNEQVFIQWFLLLRSKYKTRLAYENSKLYLLLPSLNTIYEMPYFTFDGLRYYLVNGEVSNIYTYERDYPEAAAVISLDLVEPVNTGSNVQEDNITFSVNGEEHDIKIAYNRNTIDFYRDYPLANAEVYFDAAVAPATVSSIEREFTPLTGGMSEYDEVSFLLHFVQTAFKYETDREQFGREKMFFPDELFYYPASDCEDRAVLFSYLVRKLAGLDVIGVEYPGHMAAAVKFHGNVNGDFIVFKGSKYVICDPTYINAPVGATMPEYEVSTVKPIPLKQKSR